MISNEDFYCRNTNKSLKPAKRYLEVELDGAGSFWRSSASNSACMVILTNLISAHSH